MNPKKNSVDELIAMLDAKMAEGAGHIKVTVEDAGSINIEEIKSVTGMDVDLGDTACKIPNLSVDDDDEL